ncbi:DIP1984 family protein [Caldalkalibacillus mannanilyticus]|uniref:DIP1984 family protein n=1 Tax=Caldalkalibacillus mannanilyticus TaxID=1418 RepID=UPI000A980279|nr:DIP1984 family protein [Caldalkalibacillus mannanilyticus]
MKLAEALVLRVDCQRRISQLRERLARIVKVQEGDEPAENPDLLLDELNETINELTGLIVSINKTNSLTKFDENRSIADVLAERDSINAETKKCLMKY